MISDAEKLKLLRKEYNFKTQSDLATALGFKSPSAISNIENGSRPISSIIADRIQEKFGINISCFGLNTLNYRYHTLEPIVSEIGKKLNKIQAVNGFDDGKMAEILDMSESRYEKIINNKEQLYFKELINILENFDVSADWLLLDVDGKCNNTKPSPIQDLSEKEMEIINLLRSKKLI